MKDFKHPICIQLNMVSNFPQTGRGDILINILFQRLRALITAPAAGAAGEDERERIAELGEYRRHERKLAVVQLGRERGGERADSRRHGIDTGHVTTSGQYMNKAGARLPFGRRMRQMRLFAY